MGRGVSRCKKENKNKMTIQACKVSDKFVVFDNGSSIPKSILLFLHDMKEYFEYEDEIAGYLKAFEEAEGL